MTATPPDDVRDESVPPWLEALQHPPAYPHDVRTIEQLETHLSWVLLTGDWAYKLKKPLQLSFVDFSTLESRQAACLEELRLNRRTAADIYDQVLPLTQGDAGPRFGGSGPVLEYAVRMHQFPQADLLLARARANQLNAGMMDLLSRSIAELHRDAAVAPDDSEFGSPEVIRREVSECFAAIPRGRLPTAVRNHVDLLASWTDREGLRLESHIAARRSSGFVRECHGDLHLGNIVLVNGVPRLFDCLEFNPELRFIDIVCDVAFVVMDLHDHGYSQFAWQVLNGWLEQTGDFGGMPALNYYEVYRALVRAKVAGVRLAQPGLSPDEVSQTQEQLGGYIEAAARHSRRADGALILMHGLSGSGKSVVARRLAVEIGGICTRSDVERKRLFGLWPQGRISPADIDLYSEAATSSTYDRLLELASQLLSDGNTVIVDAAFLRFGERQRFIQLAENASAPWAIVACEATDEVLERRIQSRLASGRDASDATLPVLQSQRGRRDPLTDQELLRTVRCSTEQDMNWPATLAAIQKFIPARTSHRS